MSCSTAVLPTAAVRSEVRVASGGMVQYCSTPSLLLLLLCVHRLLAEPMAERQWTSVCATPHDGGGVSVSGRVLDTFTDGTANAKFWTYVLVDNKQSDVYAGCRDSEGNAKLYDEAEVSLAENHPGSDSVELQLWKRHQTSFWHASRQLRCTAGCGVTVVKLQDSPGSPRCSQAAGPGEVWCDLTDWMATAAAERSAGKCNGGDYDHKAQFKFSFFNKDLQRWQICKEFDKNKVETRQDIGEDISFLKCDIREIMSSGGMEGLLVKMEKIHESKAGIALSFLKKEPDCQETSYFQINEEDLVSLGNAHIIIIVLSCIILFIFLIYIVHCGRKRRKNAARKSHLASAAFTNAGQSPYVEQGQRHSSIEEVENCLLTVSDGKSALKDNISSGERKEQDYINTARPLHHPMARQCSVRQEAAQKAELQQITAEQLSDSVLNGDTSRLNPDLPMSKQMTALHYNREFDRERESFVIGHVLGEGMFGTVYVGTDLSSDTQARIAVKQVKDMRNDGQINTIIDEMKILSNLKKHPNLVNLVGVCRTQLHLNEIFLLLELCPFGDLKKFLVDHRHQFEACINNVPGHLESEYNAGLLYRWSYSIAKGMEYLSSKRIMHGDLAARNILVGENFTAKISDFGLSKMMYYNQGKAITNYF